ncbi:MAG: hypothetical protein QF492_06550 [Candidatus Krumholzibacteria bacterium]|nr:hypothetical protein [Candidatus Krumholzibacteria bacterium]MDP6669545.1 hypothetical protein [Candidatus Krumholzibacteria bacterium]MDP6796372.1 hypothetical protein [Candidatus Krumholzibacteria bacterium]MDP7020881.1 hypothetical protein [Candidatus Krumholzibacteria bacterium]
MNTPTSSGPDRADSNTYWYSALSYLPFLCLLPYFRAGESKHVRFHAQQGLFLFLLEILAWILIAVLDASIGKIPFLGLLLLILLRLVLWLPVLALAVLGVAKALTGELTPLPWIGNYAERIPEPPTFKGGSPE